MLQSIRAKLGSLPVMILLALLIVGFAIWGIGDVFRGGGVKALASVGGVDISEQAYTTEFNRILRSEQQQRPGLTAAAAVEAGLDKQVLQLLVQQATMRQALGEMGITATPEQVAKAIQEQPAFQVAGKFNEQQYQQLLSQNGLTPARFQEMVGLDLARAQLFAGSTIGLRTPTRLAQAYSRLMQEQRIGTMVLVPLQAAGAIPEPSDAQLKAFYESRLAAYEAPEYRAFTYGIIGAKDLVAKVEVSKADIDQYIADHPDEFGASETRVLRQVIVQDQAVAKQISARVRKGEAFADVAKALADYAPADLDVGERTRAALAEEYNAAVATAAFGLAAGQASEPVQSDFGWHVLETTAIKPAQRMPEAQARAVAEAKVRQTKAADKLYEVTGKIEDDLAGGAALADIAAEHGVALTPVAPVAADGQTQAGEPWRADPDAAKILAEVYKHGEASDAAVVELARDRFLLVQTTTVTPAAPRPLESIRERVRADYSANQQQVRAQAIARELSTAGGDLVALARARKLPVQTGMTLSRLQVMASGQRVPAAIGLFFTQAKGQRGTAPLPNGGFAVVQVDDVKTAPVTASDPITTQLRRSIEQTSAEETSIAIQQGLEAQLGAKINQPMLAKVRAGLTGAEQ